MHSDEAKKFWKHLSHSFYNCHQICLKKKSAWGKSLYSDSLWAMQSQEAVMRQKKKKKTTAEIEGKNIWKGILQSWQHLGIKCTELLYLLRTFLERPYKNYILGQFIDKYSQVEETNISTGPFLLVRYLIHGSLVFHHLEECSEAPGTDMKQRHCAHTNAHHVNCGKQNKTKTKLVMISETKYGWKDLRCFVSSV